MVEINNNYFIRKWLLVLNQIHREKGLLLIKNRLALGRYSQLPKEDYNVYKKLCKKERRVNLKIIFLASKF